MRNIRMVFGAFCLLIFCSSTVALESWFFGEIKIEDAKEGTLGFRSEKPGVFYKAPTVNTDINLIADGAILRAKIKQRFHNPSDKWFEAVYIFPLPEKAAVDKLRMIVGKRIIEGQIKESKEAKKIYEKAKKEGKKAALAEERRDNIFTMSLANIGPKEYVDIEMEFQQPLEWSHNGYSLRFPLVVAPRYSPPAKGEKPMSPKLLTPPSVKEWEKGPTVTITAKVDAGFPIGTLQSPSHQVKIEKKTDQRHIVTFKKGVVPANKDFVLQWTPRRKDSPQSALFTESDQDGSVYTLVMLLPPKVELTRAARIARETILVIDTSGSMGGESIQQARRSLLWALDRLHPEDSFNVIQFNSVVKSLYKSAKDAKKENLDEARSYVRKLTAGGGTEMLAALKVALNKASTTGKVRQVVFITDGQVTNESRLFSFIRKNLKESRLFTVGIGSAPNTHFMKKAANFGRGTFTFIGKLKEVEKKMGALFAKIESPILADVKINWNSDSSDSWPETIPDLYAGEPLVVSAKVKNPKGAIVIQGRGGQQSFKWSLPYPNEHDHQGIGKLWARHKISGLIDSIQDGAKKTEVRKEVVDLALSHQLVSPYTSLVAVDITPSRSANEKLTTAAVPLHQPAGYAPPPPPPAKVSYNYSGGSGVPEPETWILIIITCFVIGMSAWKNRRRLLEA
mgnify:CR=1 FL=1